MSLRNLSCLLLITWIQTGVTTAELPNVCSDAPYNNGVAFWHPNEASGCVSRFFQCTNGMMPETHCNEPTKFDPINRVCNWGYNIPACSNPPTTSSTTTGPITTTATDPGPDTTTGANSPMTTAQLPNVCSDAPYNNGVAFWHPNEASGCVSRFFQCTNGMMPETHCNEPTKFDPIHRVCNWGYNIPACSNPPTISSTTTGPITTTATDPGPDTTTGANSPSSTSASSYSTTQSTPASSGTDGCTTNTAAPPTSSQCTAEYLVELQKYREAFGEWKEAFQNWKQGDPVC